MKMRSQHLQRRGDGRGRDREPLNMTVIALVLFGALCLAAAWVALASAGTEPGRERAHLAPALCRGVPAMLG